MTEDFLPMRSGRVKRCHEYIALDKFDGFLTRVRNCQWVKPGGSWPDFGGNLCDFYEQMSLDLAPDIPPHRISVHLKRE